MIFLKKQEMMLNSDHLFKEAKAAMLKKEYKEAIKKFTQSLKLNQQNRDAKFYRAISYLDIEQTRRAITELVDLIEQAPNYSKTAYIVLSIAYRRENDLNNSVRVLSKATLKYPKYVEAFMARGKIYIFLKKWDKALYDFKAVINL